MDYGIDGVTFMEFMEESLGHTSAHQKYAKKLKRKPYFNTQGP